MKEMRNGFNSSRPHPLRCSLFLFGFIFFFLFVVFHFFQHMSTDEFAFAKSCSPSVIVIDPPLQQHHESLKVRVFKTTALMLPPPLHKQNDRLYTQLLVIPSLPSTLHHFPFTILSSPSSHISSSSSLLILDVPHFLMDILHPVRERI